MSIYEASTLGTDTNLINFNDYGAYPIYRVISRRPQRRQIRELDIPIAFESGISDFETWIGQTAYVLEGIMYPGGSGDYDNGLARLRRVASLDIEQNDALSDEGYVPYVFTEFNQNKQIFMKVLYVDVPENTRKGLVQPFRYICKIKDPTIYSEELSEASTATANFSAATGTAIYSFKYPIIFGASTSSVSVDAQNTGDIAAYPVSITIYGPINGPKITNTATGEYIELTGVNLSTGSNVLSISYDKDSLRVEVDGVTAINQVTSTSTYWKLQPGSNVISLTGSSVGTGAYATVAYRSAWPLS